MDSEGDPSAEYLEALVNTVPGTNNDVWWYKGPASGSGSWYPEWVAGQEPGHYFPGGGYKLSHPDSTSLVLGCYAEDDDGSGHVYSGKQFATGGIQTYVTAGGRLIVRQGNEIALTGDTAVGQSGVT